MPRARLALCALGALGVLLGDAAGAHAQIYTRRTDSGAIEATNIPDGDGFALTYPGKGRVIHSRGFRGRYNGEFDHVVAAASATYGVGASLIHAVIRAESSYDQYAVSSKGAQGLMQLMPGTARMLGVGNAFDARQNILAGTRYLRMMLDRFDGNLSFALAGYNAGPNAVKRWGGVPPYKETRRYVSKIRSWLSPRADPRQAASFTPRRRPPAPTRVEPAVPRVYYKYRDTGGALHVSNSRPPDGVPYVMIRALP